MQIPNFSVGHEISDRSLFGRLSSDSGITEGFIRDLLALATSRVRC